MATILVTPDDLRTVSGQLSSGATDVNSQLTRLQSLVQTLITDGWTGGASDAFSALYSQWTTAATQLHHALEGISTQLGSAARTYEDTESQLAAQLKNG